MTATTRVGFIDTQCHNSGNGDMIRLKCEQGARFGITIVGIIDWKDTPIKSWRRINNFLW